jgi:protein-tyrosine phosphatase
MAEGFLRARLEDRGVAATVSSAGLAFDDRPATPEAVSAAGAWGVDIGRHASRVLDRAMVDRADLVIAMERLHAREAAVLVPGALAKTYPLKELVRRAEAAGPRRPDEPFEAWLGRVGVGRRAADLLDVAVDDDVADPFQRSASVYAACAAELAALIDRLVVLAWPRDNRRAEAPKAGESVA